MEGPYTSVSINPIRSPLFFSAKARLTATVDLPTPPFPEAIAIVREIFLMLLFSSFLSYIGNGIIVLQHQQRTVQFTQKNVYSEEIYRKTEKKKILKMDFIYFVNDFLEYFLQKNHKDV
ncbi:unknown protein [Waddlia chondrophila 2032/99]|uniref:Uncharacterized protein n=1 Tax=Waddlia chondrophila 2032/99 TaxID=765953 RepID=F8LF71_9BACT|nr:unknown protein [Waddlia chondrophila 2032/99]